MMTMYTATYSPDDNKLRLYASTRLDAETYARVKAAGFAWAPKQDLFVAPMWTPAREDLLIELAGEILDEDKSLVDRAEERADRFEDYSDKRKREADAAHKAVESIVEHIPLGQPILVGHHSERRARKDAERIESGMKKAVNLWKTSTYWSDRAAGALQHAKYKELPAVRARRIKKIEADLRKALTSKLECEARLRFWSREEITLAQAKAFANSHSFYLARKDGDDPTFSGKESAWGALDRLEKGETSRLFASRTLEEVIEAGRGLYPPLIEHYARWVEHYENRLTYERAMLAEQIGVDDPGKRWPFAIGGKVSVKRDGGAFYTIVRVNKSGGAVVSLTLAGRRYVPVVGVEEVTDYQEPTPELAAKVKKATALAPLCNYPGEGIYEITKANYDKIHNDYKGGRVVKATEKHGAHRLRYVTGCYVMPKTETDWNKRHGYVPVFITDAKRKDPPAPEADAAPAPEVLARVAAPAPAPAPRPEPKPDPDAEKFKALEQAAKAGVQVVAAHQLFETPRELAREVIELAGVQPGHLVLEPSAGTGRLIETLPDGAHVTAIEVNHNLAQHLRRFSASVWALDFLAFGGEDGSVLYDRIVMNPPFENGADVKHIRHALKFLKPGGRLVAICANGPRQREAFRETATEWRDLPPGTFKESGTMVNAAIVVIDAPRALAEAAE